MSGQVLGAVRATPGFDNLVLSWQPRGDVPFDVSARVRFSDRWSRWYRIANWDAGPRRRGGTVRDPDGFVDVDTLRLHSIASALQLRIRFDVETVQAPPVRSVWATVANLSIPASEVAANDWHCELDVMPRSQMEEPDALRREICSPTCVAMALEFFGVNRSTLDVADGVYDTGNGIYGNWPFNTAYACLQGLRARVVRMWSLAQLRGLISDGVVPIVSLRWEPGELDGAPIPRSAGHLMLVRGFTAGGDVVVNDPAAPSQDTVRRLYRAEQFGPRWLGAGGVTYVFERPPSARGEEMS